MKKALRSIWRTLGDFFRYYLPQPFVSKSYGYAFIVHARDYRDVSRRYPIFRNAPKWIVDFFTRHLWPVTLSEVTGLTSIVSGKPLRGWVITIPLTAEQMLESRELALKRIVQAIILAKKRGAKIVGLGALTSSVTHGGLKLVDKVDIGITTGHAYTAFNVTKNVFEVAKLLDVNIKDASVAILGATGSIGSTSAEILARAGCKKMILVDLPRKSAQFADIKKKLRELNPEISLEIGHQMALLKKADFLITATNAPEALVHADDLKAGCVVFDDAQPSDVASDVYEREDTLVLEAGVVKTPGIKSNFNFGLKDREDNFCCMAELLTLASREWRGHYIIARADLKAVDEIVWFADGLNFNIADFQNVREKVSEEKIKSIKKVLEKNARLEF